MSVHWSSGEECLRTLMKGDSLVVVVSPCFVIPLTSQLLEESISVSVDWD